MDPSLSALCRDGCLQLAAGPTRSLAAQEAQLPFFYEVCGFWELSRASHDPQWAASEAFQEAVAQETAVARMARRVFTLNGAMAAELRRRGIPEERIALVPNGITLPAPTASLDPVPPGLAGRQVMGYVGSFNTYEGLADLLQAAAHLVQSGVDFALLLVGGSHAMGLVGPGVSVPCPASAELRALAASLGLADRLVGPGRVPADQVGAYYALMDVVVLPRRPLPVCELVSPMKPLEAVAHGKPVLMSSVAPLAELTSLGPALRCFKKGNVEALTTALADLLAPRVNMLPGSLPLITPAATGRAASSRWWQPSPTWSQLWPLPQTPS